jgi:hypothetical protein
MTSEEEKQHSLRDFQNPSIWPYWPYQTIKRRKLDGSMPDCALLVDLAPTREPFDVHFLAVDLFELNDKVRREELIAEARTRPAIDAQALINEGWVID